MSIKGLKKDQYDVVIIGAGIGGLVCGCYLAKAGLKVLIVEQHYKAGGCCQSFTRNGFTFDVGMHALVSCSEEGLLGRIIRELELQDKLTLIKINPSDVIINAGHKLAIKNDINETIVDLQKRFPLEAKAIEKFFNFIKNARFISLFSDFKDKTFKDILDLYFKDMRLRSLLSVLLGNIGLPAHRVSALAAIFLYKEHIFDGGYYPSGGMQAFPDAFVEKFREYGGRILFSTKATNIRIRKNEVEGIVINTGDFIKSKYVISACDVNQTFLELIGEQKCDKKFITNLKAMVPAITAFLVFLGINKDLKNQLDICSGLWYFPINDINVCWEEMQTKFSDKGVLCIIPSSHTQNLAPVGSSSVTLMVTLPFIKDLHYWEENKKVKIENEIISKFEEIVPNISSFIKIKESATPYTFYKYTLNTNGSIRGWSALPQQLNNNFIKANTEFENLFIAGHWLISPVSAGGVSMVADSGRRVAKLILLKR